ncbi:IS3 family transposase [Enterobacter mori]|uniref:IS3 family transposase n=1 Tax=Enterobacter mori TaxID=539813 RepID=UPI003B981267
MSAANIRANRNAQIVDELRLEHSLKGLLNVAKLARSTFYYHTDSEQHDACRQERKLVHDIYHKHKGCYGYRRITVTLRQSGIILMQLGNIYGVLQG